MHAAGSGRWGFVAAETGTGEAGVALTFTHNRTHAQTHTAPSNSQAFLPFFPSHPSRSWSFSQNEEKKQTEPEEAWIEERVGRGWSNPHWPSPFPAE